MSISLPDDVEGADPTLDTGTEDQHTVTLSESDHDLDVTPIVEGSFWKKELIEPDEEIELPITDVGWTTFRDKNGKPEKRKPLLTLGHDKTFASNPTNTKVMARAFGNDMHQWIGRRVRLWHDPNVSFGSQILGGLRVRIPKSERKRGPAPVNTKAGRAQDIAEVFSREDQTEA